MTYSKVHLHFANSLSDNQSIESDEVLLFPEHFLGPNYETVLNYWKFLDKFSSKDFRKRSLLSVASGNLTLRDLARSITSYQADAWVSTSVAHNISYNYGWVTVELIAMHKILEEGKSLVYVPQLFNE